VFPFMSRRTTKQINGTRLGHERAALAFLPGFVWAATFDHDGRGVLRFLTIDASQIATVRTTKRSPELTQPIADVRESAAPHQHQLP
jgi:hypothetical protein